MFESLEGAVAVVTGGASGIGQACCRRLHELGVAVVAADRDGARAERIATEIGPGVEPVALDVTSRADLDALAAHIRERHGRLDVLVNSAGINTGNYPAEELPAEDFRLNFEVNCLGSVQAAQALFPLLREGPGGAIVNIASQAALVSLPWQTSYSVSKGAVATLTRSLAIDWADKGVRVNCICPGFTITPMSEPMLTEALVNAVSRRVPVGRLFQAVEMANVICFLASPLASAVTGVVIPVDGGWTAGEPALPME